MSTTDNATERIDGRTARRDRNRVAVLDAVIELFAEGMLSPGVPEVAERSGVSLRSVYRYFEDSDALVSAAIDRQIDLARPLFVIEGEGEGPVADRIDRLVDGRFRVYGMLRPVYLAARSRGTQDPLIAEGARSGRAFLTRQTRRMFAPEIAAADEPDALHSHLDLITQFDAMEFLLNDLGLDEQTAGDRMRAALTTALGG